MVRIKAILWLYTNGYAKGNGDGENDNGIGNGKFINICNANISNCSVFKVV